MNREIKFRAYVPSTGLIHRVLNFCFQGKKKIHISYNPAITASLDDCYLMQYTGLKDKNGKEIYEGDLIEWGESTRRMEKVRFFKGCFSCDRKEVKNNPIPIMLLSKIEVIGNIYENPELLTNK